MKCGMPGLQLRRSELAVEAVSRPGSSLLDCVEGRGCRSPRPRAARGARAPIDLTWLKTAMEAGGRGGRRSMPGASTEGGEDPQDELPYPR
jgi:hypothetical protein